jgi:RimJ/RimL family protein N-acetyltransferase
MTQPTGEGTPAMTAPDFAPVATTLRNGLVVTLRPLRADDRGRVAKLVRGLDAETIYTRLFSHRKELTEAALDRIMHTDANEVVLVATIGSGADEIIIGGGRFVVTTTDNAAPAAEIAFTVEEDFQGLGLAGRLLDALVKTARRQGIVTFEADVLADNASMLRVFERSGLPMRRRPDGATVHVELALQHAS